MKIIGLTGQIGSGKSEVSKILKKLGAYIIEADKIGHELIKSKAERKIIGEVVFSDPKELKRLNAIMHPYISKRIKEEISRIDIRYSIFEFVVIDAALPELFKGLVDETWVITAPKELRIKRLLRSGLTKEQITKRMKNQLSQKEYEKLADKIIANKGTIKQLYAQIQDSI